MDSEQTKIEGNRGEKKEVESKAKPLLFLVKTLENQC
jgi:hypothetical protein